MDRAGHSNIAFFTGREIERTPQYGQHTLFVVGVQSVDTIVKHADMHGCNHIYLGADMSFNVTVNTQDQWDPWEKIGHALLDRNFWVTLDIDASQVEGLLETGLTEKRRFIPMISVKLPYIDQLGYNACIKIDDKDFDASNPGVWVHQLETLKHRNNFTCWDNYTQDEVIK
jgi:hypothetical protein